VYKLSGKIPGKGWVGRFSNRNQELCSSKPSNLDPKRAQNFNASNIKHFFGLVKTIFDAHPNLSPNHIWNMDEKGLQLGGGRKQRKKFFRPESLKQSNFYRIRSDNLELVTIIECISPSGLSIPPSFVLSAGPIPALTDLDVEIGAVATSPNGWTDNELGTNWFEHTFIPFAISHKVSDDPIILFLDGHDSHETDTLRKLAFDNNIYVVTFPSKCTHKLQPLDVVVFAQTQRSWASHCDRRIIEGVPMTCYNVIQEYMRVRSQTMTPDLCRSTFTCTGLFPFNPDVFTAEDFAPAKSYSTSMHALKTFPAEAPSSSPCPSDLSDIDSSSDSEESEDQPPQLDLDWETDSDDYEPPSHMSALGSASCPPAFSFPATSSAPSSCPPAPSFPATSSAPPSCPPSLPQ
jgi:hypothetical protein